MDKAQRDMKREAIWTAYVSRIATKDADPASGRLAGYLCMALLQISGLVLVGGPLLLMGLAQHFLGPNEAAEAIGTLSLLVGTLWFLTRILLPVCYDVVWRMDILSNKYAFVRPEDVCQTFAVWSGLEGKHLPLFRRICGDA